MDSKLIINLMYPNGGFPLAVNAYKLSHLENNNKKYKSKQVSVADMNKSNTQKIISNYTKK